MTGHRDDHMPDDLFEADVDERLADWVDDRLSDRDRERFEAELRVSPQLRERLEQYRATVATIQAALRAPTHETEIADRVMATLAEQASRPIVPGRAAWPFVFAIATAAALLAIAVWVDSWGAREPADAALTTTVATDREAETPADEPASSPDHLSGRDRRGLPGEPAKAEDEPAPAAERARSDMPDASGSSVSPKAGAAAPEPKQMLELEVRDGQVRRQVEVPPPTAPIERKAAEDEPEPSRRRATGSLAEELLGSPDRNPGRDPEGLVEQQRSARSEAAPTSNATPAPKEVGDQIAGGAGNEGGAQSRPSRGGRPAEQPPGLPGGGGGAGGPATPGPGAPATPELTRPSLGAVAEKIEADKNGAGRDGTAGEGADTSQLVREKGGRKAPESKSPDEPQAAGARQMGQLYRGPGDVVPNSSPMPRAKVSTPRFATGGEQGEVLALLTIEGSPQHPGTELGGAPDPAGRLEAFLLQQMRRAGETVSTSFAIGGLQFAPVAAATGTVDAGEATVEPAERNWFVEGPEPELAALLVALRRFADTDGCSLRAGEAALMPAAAEGVGPGGASPPTGAGVVRRRLVLRFRPRSG